MANLNQSMTLAARKAQWAVVPASYRRWLVVVRVREMLDRMKPDAVPIRRHLLEIPPRLDARFRRLTRSE